MDRVRIIHVVHSLGTGGTEEGIRKLLAGLDRDRFQQIVCTVAPAPAVEPRTGARVISLHRTTFEKGSLIRKLARVFRRERPDIVHSRNWGAIEAIPAARLAGVTAVIHSEHGLESPIHYRQPWRRRVFRQLSFRWADRVFAVSHGLREYYAQQLRIARNRILVLPNGVDTEHFRPQVGLRNAVRRRLGIDEHTPVVGTVGRLDRIKDHRTLLAAAELVLAQGSELRIVIVGDGPERRALEAEARARGLLASRTLIVGETDDVLSQLNCFDMFVLPSLAEGMSNALLEAMSVGVAPIASRVGGNPELIEDGVAGLLFEPGDQKALASHLAALISDPQLRCQLGSNARKRVEASLSLERMLENYARLYEEVLNVKHTDSAFLSQVPVVRT